MFPLDWRQCLLSLRNLRSGLARPERRIQGGRHYSGGQPIARVTGPLGELAEKRVLVLADVENLNISAKRLERMLCYDRLTRMLEAPASRIDCHAFFSRERGDGRLEAGFAAIGWHTHVRDVTKVRTKHGLKRLANADHILCFGAGRLVAPGEHDLVILATGDGALGCDIAACLRAAASTPIGIVTASLAGSTSYRLNAEGNGDIDCNIEIGEDCLQPRRMPRGEGFWADPVSSERIRHVPAL